ncbi:MAG: hypothetical protein HN366_05905 [Deltaproteobacteria bacterium]|jgi:hypothetical protein|nr:hypothetical protein [Deltaproteobacteria bacterium]
MPKVTSKQSFPFDRPGNYSIRVLGSLDESWSERLGGLRITVCSQTNREGPVTELAGLVRDQAELSGLLNTLYELHLTLLAVEFLENDTSK